jgi:hypothetical protein
MAPAGTGVQDVGLRDAGRDHAAYSARGDMGWAVEAGLAEAAHGGGEVACEAAGTDEGGDAQDDCVVCLDQRPVFALTECGHFCMCAGCCERILAGQRRCPVCNVAIVDPPLRIFRP